MKITFEHYKQKYIVETASDSNLTEVMRLIRGLLITAGFSIDNINEYIKDE